MALRIVQGHIIDMHSHYYGDSLIKYLMSRDRPPFIRKTSAGLYTFTTHSGTSPFDISYTSLEERQNFMRYCDIEKQIITFPGSLGIDYYSVDIKTTEAIIGSNNDMINAMNIYEASFECLAGIPMFDLALSIAEYKRTRQLGCLGLILPTIAVSSQNNIELYADLFSAVNDDHGHILLHPAPVISANIKDTTKQDGFHWINESVFNLMDQVAKSLVSIIKYKLVDCYPNISWQLIALGGSFVFSYERIKSIINERDVKKIEIATIPKQIFFDTSSMGTKNIEYFTSYYGTSNIILGSDYPIFLGLDKSLIENSELLTSQDKKNIMHENADSIIRKCKRYG